VPSISEIAPATRYQSQPGFTLTVTGSNFLGSATVRWNGSPRPTIPASGSTTQLFAQIPASDLASAGAQEISVVNSSSGAPSNSVAFTVQPLTPGGFPLLQSVSTSGAPGNNESVSPAISADGRFVAFWSSSTDLIQNDIDQNGFNGDLFLYDRFSSANILLTHALGAPSTGGNNGSGDSQHTGGPVWSGDGHSLMFASRASDLVNDDFNNREDVFALSVPLLPTSVVSRKVHGSAGSFNIDLPQTGSPGIECRTGGANGDYMLVFSFANLLTSVGGASVSSGTGCVSSSAVGNDAHQYVVNLTGVTNAQTVRVGLTNVSDSNGNFSSIVSASMSVLVGDVNATGAIRISNGTRPKQRPLQPVNCRDVRR